MNESLTDWNVLPFRLLSSVQHPISTFWRSCYFFFYIHAGLFWCFHNPPNSEKWRTTGSLACINTLFASTHTQGTSDYNLIWRTLCDQLSDASVLTGQMVFHSSRMKIMKRQNVCKMMLLDLVFHYMSYTSPKCVYVCACVHACMCVCVFVRACMWVRARTHACVVCMWHNHCTRLLGSSSDWKLANTTSDVWRFFSEIIPTFNQNQNLEQVLQ